METLEMTYNDQTVQFKHFTPKSENLVKIRIQGSGMGEGIWACVSDEDLVKYKDDTDTTSMIVCNLRNDSINGIPWGTYVIAQCQGDDRPNCILSLMGGDMVSNDEATVEK